MLQHFKNPFAVSLLLTGCFVALNADIATAQTDPSFPGLNVPTQVSPGLQPQPKDLDREQRRLEQKEDVPEVKIDVPEPGPSVQLQSPRFQVNDITVNGVTVYRPEKIEEMVSQYEGQSLTLDELGKLVDEINKLYRGDGYLTTQAYIPPQDIQEGRVAIQVLEGRIGTISVSGNKFYRTFVLERNIPQQPGEVLNIRDLEDALNRINQRENFRLKAVLSPGDETGETDIRLEIAERQPWQIAGTFDNQGRPFIGMYRYGVELTNQNLTGMGDRLYARWIGARGDGTNVALAGYALPLNRFGTEAAYNFGYSRVNVDLDIRNQPKIEGSAANHQVLLSQPLDKNRTWVVDAGFNARNISSYIDNVRTNRDSIYSLQFGLNFDQVDRWGRTFARGQFTVAPDWGGSHNEQFSKYEVFFTRLIRLPWRNMLILRANTQLTPDALPPAEQFQIGGAFSVRGFTEGVIVGDRGWNFGVEHRWPIPFLRSTSPYLADRVQGAFFFDFGQAWLDKSNPAYIGGLSHQPSRTMLISAGTGVRARLTRYAQGFVDFGWGLVDRSVVEPTAQPTFRVHFGIRSELLPDKIVSRDTGEAEVIKESKLITDDEAFNASAVEDTNDASQGAGLYDTGTMTDSAAINLDSVGLDVEPEPETGFTPTADPLADSLVEPAAGNASSETIEWED